MLVRLMTSPAESSGRLHGRDATLATTGAALADACRGTGGLLLVAGEPGIGKSAVLAVKYRGRWVWGAPAA